MLLQASVLVVGLVLFVLSRSKVAAACSRARSNAAALKRQGKALLRLLIAPWARSTKEAKDPTLSTTSSSYDI